ncbi:hypothetical protein Tco_0120240 [Tanacetum coccineum]
MIRLRAEAASTSYSLPLPPPIIVSYTRPDAPSSGIPPLHLLSTDRRADRTEVGESSSATAARPARGLRADYGFVATMDREIMLDLERDVGYGITDSWDEIGEAMQGTPVVIDVAEFSQRMTEFETRRHRLGCLKRLGDDPWTLVTWRALAEVMSLRTTVLAQQSEIRELQAADHRRQTVITEMLAADRRRRKQFTEALNLIKRLQT